MIASVKSKTAASSSTFEFLVDKTGVPFVRLSCYLPPDVDRRSQLEVIDAILAHLTYLRGLELQ